MKHVLNSCKKYLFILLILSAVEWVFGQGTNPQMTGVNFRRIKSWAGGCQRCKGRA